MVGVKTGLNKLQATTLLKDFFKQFQICFKGQAAPKPAEFEKFLSKNFQININGNNIARNLTEYLNRITKLQKEFTNFEINGPLEEPVINEHKMAVIFETVRTLKNGKKSVARVIAIATVEDGKILHWEEVGHEKGEDWLTSKNL